MNATALSGPETVPGKPMAWQAWGLIKQEILFLCWALMDVAILTPLALLLMRWALFWDVGFVTLWLLFIILLPFNLVRLLSAAGVLRKQQQIVIFVALFLTLLISWRGLLYAPRPIADLGWLAEFSSHLGDLGNPSWGRDFVVFSFVLLAWWRGLRLAQLTPDIQRAGFRLRAGVLLLAPLGLLLFAVGNIWGATPFVLLYFLAGLTAVSVIRAEQIEREQSGFAASLTPRWILTIVATSLLVVMTAGLVGAVISGEASQLITGRLAPVWTTIWAITAVSLSTVIYLLSPLLYVFSLLVTLLSNLFSRIFALAGAGLDANAMPSQGALQSFNDLIDQTNPISFAFPPIFTRALIVSVMIISAAMIVLFLTRQFRQPQVAARTGVASEKLAAANRPPASLTERLLQRLGLIARWRTAVSIRHIYDNMCRAAAATGHPRGASETPYEYLAALTAVWPGNQSDCRLITEAYIRVRYGEVPETEDELKAIQTAWQRLSTQRYTDDSTGVTLNKRES